MFADRRPARTGRGPVALALALVAALLAGGLAPAPTLAVSTTIVISEFRTRGPNGGNDEFVELFNRSAAAVNIGGWRINGSNSTGSVSTRLTIPAGVTLGAGCRYLATNSSTSGGPYGGAVAGDQTYATGITDDGGIAVLDGAGTLIDAVGMSSGSAYKEGATLAPQTASANHSYERRPGGANSQDTDSNSADFLLNSTTSNPQNRASACTAGSTPTPTRTPTPTSTPTRTPTPTPRPTPTPSGTRIRDIQGAAHRSPREGQSVSNVNGIVTVLRSNGFYMQDASPDADPATSEGIFVFTSSAPTVAVGNAVRVSGTVSEFRPGGTDGATNLTTTQISPSAVTVVSASNPLPAAVVIGSGGRVPPAAVIDNDATGDVETSGSFDAATDGIDFYESLEGMLVQVTSAVVVGPTSSNGEIVVLPDNGAGAGLRTPRGGVVIGDGYADFNPERITLDDALAAGEPQVNVGDRFSTAVSGVIDYSFGNFKLLARSWPAVTAGGLPRESASTAAAGQFTVATFNVENLDPGDGATKFNTLAGYIVSNLKSPDLIALEEVQDNNGATNDAVVSPSTTMSTLISAISAAGGPVYQYRQINPVDDQDGGEPGGNIRLVFLYRTDRGLSFIDRAPPAGVNLSTAGTSVVSGAGGPQLTYSPGRIDPANSAWSSSRKPLAGEFSFNGVRLFVIANHFNSKGGDQPLFGHFQPPARSSETQRQQQATVVRTFVSSILALDAGARVIVLGDLNDFEFSPALGILKAGGLSALIETLPKAERYSYVYEGNAQTLDHIMVSAGLVARLAAYDVVHVNAEFANPVSDHDPQLARFTLP
ncbi:MAG TPA: lamin tail domain-containing protein [Roseiflexaceae bacterium]|nr:lamin tail domain-containing protein [Roseiflexaceae bacterium]